MDLIEILGRHLSPEDRELLKAESREHSENDYAAMFQRVASRLEKENELFSFARSRLKLRFKDLLELPEGRRLTVLKSSSPVVLLVLFRKLVEESFEERFGDLERSLVLARVAVEVSETVTSSTYLSPRDGADLLAEAHCYLGNAKRINSDLPGAEESLKRAEVLLQLGTGDRALRAQHLSFLASLRGNQGRCPEMAKLLDREIALRRILGDERKLGTALVERGWVACWIEPIVKACDLIEAGIALVDDDHVILSVLHHLAETLAREGSGEDAMRALVAAAIPLSSVDSERHYIHHRGIRGIAYRALGRLKEAESELRAVRSALRDSDASFYTAIVNLDLACVCAARGKMEEVRRLAGEAYDIFRAEGLEERALSAVILLREAIEAERATEELAAAVTDFLVRFRHDKQLRFEWVD